MVADPGSMAAIEQGCICPRMDNADMRGTGLFVIFEDCPLHGESTKDVNVQAMACIPDVPLERQQEMLCTFLLTGLSGVTEFIREHWSAIVTEAVARHADGYREYGSRMYSWSEDERRQNIIEELADALVYMSSGPYIKASGGKLE